MNSNIHIFKVLGRPDSDLVDLDDVLWDYWVAYDAELGCVIAEAETRAEVLKQLPGGE